MHKKSIRILVWLVVCAAVSVVASFQTFYSAAWSRPAHRRNGPECVRGVAPARRHVELVEGTGVSLCRRSLIAPIFEQQWMAVDLNEWVRHPAHGKARWIKQDGTRYIQTYDAKQSVTALAVCDYYGHDDDNRPWQVFVHYKVEAFGTYWSANKRKNNRLDCIGFKNG